MSKEDTIRISNYKNNLVSLNSFREMRKLKPEINRESEVILTSIEEEKKDEEFADVLISNTLKTLLKSKKKVSYK
jgi:hypothetical protein